MWYFKESAYVTLKYLLLPGLPLVPVVILAAVGGFYGLTEVVPADDVTNPYRM